MNELIDLNNEDKKIIESCKDGNQYKFLFGSVLVLFDVPVFIFAKFLVSHFGLGAFEIILIVCALIVYQEIFALLFKDSQCKFSTIPFYIKSLSRKNKDIIEKKAFETLSNMKNVLENNPTLPDIKKIYKEMHFYYDNYEIFKNEETIELIDDIIFLISNLYANDIECKHIFLLQSSMPQTHEYLFKDCKKFINEESAKKGLDGINTYIDDNVFHEFNVSETANLYYAYVYRKGYKKIENSPILCYDKIPELVKFIFCKQNMEDIVQLRYNFSQMIPILEERYLKKESTDCREYIKDLIKF